MQRDGAGLDVGADAHLLGRADEDGGVAGAGCGEEAGLLYVGFRLVHVPDLLGGDATMHELVPHLVVGVPPVLVRGADVEGAGFGPLARSMVMIPHLAVTHHAHRPSEESHA